MINAGPWRCAAASCVGPPGGVPPRHRHRLGWELVPPTTPVGGPFPTHSQAHFQCEVRALVACSVLALGAAVWTMQLATLMATLNYPEYTADAHIYWSHTVGSESILGRLFR